MCWQRNPFGERDWYACQVKGPTLTGSAAGDDSLRTVLNQLQQAADTPFYDTDGAEVYASHCLLITSSLLSPLARESVRGLLAQRRLGVPTRILDAADLISLITQHTPSLLLPWQDILSEYARHLGQVLRLHQDYRAFGLREQPVLETLYVDVRLRLHIPTLYVAAWDEHANYTVTLEHRYDGTFRAAQKALLTYLGTTFKISPTTSSQSSHSIDVEYGTLFAALCRRLGELVSAALNHAPIEASLDSGRLQMLMGSVRAIRLFVTLSKHLGREVSTTKESDSSQKLVFDNPAVPEFVFRSFARTFVVGPPGTGKSTLCRYHAFLFAADVDAPNSVVPVVISLASYPPHLESLRAVIASSMQEPGLEIASIPLDDLLQAGRFIIFLDGLDELPLGLRDSFERHVEQFGDDYPKTHIVITSRYLVDAPVFRAYDLYHTTLLSLDQIVEFCGKWFHDDKVKAERLRRLVIDNATFRVLCGNPLYLTLVAALLTNDRPIPARRVEIYQEWLDLMLATWDYSRRVHRNVYDSELKRRLLKKLASHVQTKRRKAFAYDEYVQVVKKWLPSKFKTPALCRALLDEIVNNNGLIRVVDESSYDFWHLSFQEYLAALDLVDSGDVARVAEACRDLWWRQVGLFACGILREADDVLLELVGRRSSERKEGSDSALWVEIVGEADWTSDVLVANIARANLSVQAEKEVAAARVVSVFGMRHRAAYRVLLSAMEETPDVFDHPGVRTAFMDAAGTELYDEIVERRAALSEGSRQWVIEAMKERDTQVEREYLPKLEQT